jgi:hypothetical protein
LTSVKNAAGATPVFVNTGVNDKTVRELLLIADAAIVGTYFKVAGIFENPTDKLRVARLMQEVTELRASL